MFAVILICLIGTFMHVHADLDRQLEGKVAVITGGAKGIGYAIADNFLRKGTKNIIIVDKNQTLGLEAEKNLNLIHGANRTTFIYGHITKDLDTMTERIFQTFDYVDILINNAGVLNEYDPRITIETNALGTVLWTDRFYNCIRKDRGGRGGTIINIASISAYMNDPFIYFYKASKFAVLGLTLGIGHEYNYLTSGVRVFAICPGLTRTDMTLNQQITVDEQVKMFSKFSEVTPWQEADDVGKAAAVLFETATTGTAYTVEGAASPVASPDRVNVTLDFLLLYGNFMVSAD